MSVLPVLIPVILFVQAELTWYDPARGGLNCDHDCSTLAAGTPFSPALYGHTLACPPEFPIGTEFTIAGSRWSLADGRWTCLDRGGAVVTRGGVVSLDLMVPYPVWRETLRVRMEMPDWLRR